MIDVLLGVPGKLKAISDYLTTNLAAVRATKIDNLDAAISTRAPASTAVSSTDWTPARAAKLDGAIQTSVIQSIQGGRTGGTTSTGPESSGPYAGNYYLNVTIASVSPGKCVVTCTLNFISPGDVTIYYSGIGVVTSATNLRIYGGAQNGFLATNWTVVEYK